MGLLLLAACDRALYVGRDEPLALRAERDAEVEPIEAPAVADASLSEEPPVEPPVQTMPVTPMVTAAPCDASHMDCDGDASNGCETDVSRDREHCGACGTRCETSDCSCDNGKLTLRCDAGRGDCDGMLSNGCETDLTTSMQHCGACQRLCHTNGHDVTSATCQAGRCEITCAPRISPEADCDGDPDNGCETYLAFSAQHCGACGNACPGNGTCEAGTCRN